MAAVLVAAVASGCGAQSHAGAARQVRPFPVRSSISHVPPVWFASSPLAVDAPAGLGGAVMGQPQYVRSRGAQLRVTVHRLINPLKVAGSQLPAGMHAVAASVQIRNTGPRTYDSSATGDFTLAVSAGPVTPLLVPNGTCKTPVEDFDRAITPYEDRVGCVAFTVSDNARVEAVRFSPHAQAAGRLTWRVPASTSSWRP